ncbi:MAG: lipoate--protein ligase family protein [Planctomycetia bacterium]|nr:lipoate--protein ligase family protein [Planctomycetia bacterium]
MTKYKKYGQMERLELTRLELTLPTAAENIALDEALLLHCEAAGDDAEVFRLWEPAAPMVVLGRSSQVAAEVKLDACQRDHVPILRRTSGGASIVAAPGSLMYAVVLSYARRPALRAIDLAHTFVLRSILAAVEKLVPGVRRAGTSDLVLGDQKFSGNSLRCRRKHLLYHGTILCDMPLDLVERYLRTPPRQPQYRAGRGHGEFLIGLPVERAALRAALSTAFDASTPLADWPRELTGRLVAEKYSRDEWNLNGK